jgi:hypothetical protein
MSFAGKVHACRAFPAEKGDSEDYLVWFDQVVLSCRCMVISSIVAPYN